MHRTPELIQRLKARAERQIDSPRELKHARPNFLSPERDAALIRQVYAVVIGGIGLILVGALLVA